MPGFQRQGSWDQAAQQEIQNVIPEANNPVTVSADGAIPVYPGFYRITKATAAALTLAAPANPGDDGKVIMLQSNTAAAHVLTATGLLNTGAASVNVATMAAFAGATLKMIAFGGKWNVLSQTGVTFT